MFKAMKKLKKFWARKKKKKKPYGYFTSSSYHSSSSYSSYYIPPPTPPQPSAPPLPPWLETSPLLQAHPDLSYYPTHAQEQTPTNLVIDNATTAAAGSSSSSSSTSYQQYMDPLPAAYGIPVVQQREESAADFYTLFVKFGANLFGCFLPCFRIQEVPPRYNKPLELACE
ncbi:hypothetical protein LINPERPRIM_LOCUS5690 [Linum perenne]